MPNRLIHETSPYLCQHAENPVDWYPWGEEALRRAREEDRPILLSVGYSACHWCHVMERESFEDHEVAEIMNREFVNVKVDREERPDLDEVYMQAVQAFTGGHGGWPMTVFLMPDGRPYLAGTYFPPAPAGGMPSFRQMLGQAVRLYRERREAVDQVSSDVVEQIRSYGKMPAAAGGQLTPRWLDAVAEACEDDFDEVNPGFGAAPRFPPSARLSILLAHWRRTGRRRSLEIAARVLDAMAAGGLYDLLGGGFARYSIDVGWLIPHFEKMLYDNAQLAPVYLDASLATGEARFARIGRETLEYVLREMTGPEGGFFASQDADSEGVEGKFYVWTPGEIEAVLGSAANHKVCDLLHVSAEGNFEHGRSVLHLGTRLEELAPEDRSLLVDRAFPALFRGRETRVHPGRDEKVITAWNALMISAFARGAAVLGETRYAAAARRAATFLVERVTVAGRLQRTWKDGRAHLPAYLDDHAFFVQALLDLYEATFELAWLERAVLLADRMVELFWDEKEGGFFYTGKDVEPLVARTTHLLGGAEPSGNGVAALAFSRLEEFSGRKDLGEKAERILRAFQPLVEKVPLALGAEALAGAWRTGPVEEIGIVGAPGDPATAAFLEKIRGRYQPFRIVARVDRGSRTALLPWMEGRDAVQGIPTAYFCRDRACRAPTRDPEELAAQLEEADQAVRGSPGSVQSGRLHAPALPADPAAWLNVEKPLPSPVLRGNIVVLDFWTYCCANCMHVLPELARVEETFAGEPVVVIGVHSAKFPAEKETANVVRAVRRHHIRHPVIVDSAHALWEQFAVKSWPTLTVLDAEGRIAWSRSGEVKAEEVQRVVARLLREARETGTAAQAPAWSVGRPRPMGQMSGLCFPGKVRVFPTEEAQAGGEDPFGIHARLYVSDTGHDRILEASLSPGPDGWPEAKLLRIFGAGEPGREDGEGRRARFRGPQGLFREDERLWVADTENHLLRAIDLGSGQVTTVAGTGELARGGGADLQRPTAVSLRSPWDVVARNGTVFIAMAGSHQLWGYLIEADRIGPVLGSGKEGHEDGPAAQSALAQPSGLALFGQYLFFADSESSSIRALDLSEGKAFTVVGHDLFDFGDVDGVGEEVLLQHPLAVTVASSGVLYVADTFNNKVKAIELDGRRARTIVGGHPAVLWEPGGITLAGDFLIVADTNNHRLRAIQRHTAEIRDLPIIGLG